MNDNSIMITSENKSQTIKDLFIDNCLIRIPAYQRAYSWENKQCVQFLDDLVEQKGKKYYLGQLLFEKDANTYFIIDGQQRLTTTVLFFSALTKVLTIINENTDLLRTTYLTDKFKTIEDDQILFKRCTQKHFVSENDDTETISQRRIIEAYKYFETELEKLQLDELKLIQHSLENAIISTFFITSKTEATQVFEYQNNRGKDLSKFEIIKAFLMHQIYIHTDSETANGTITDIQKVISKTYRDIENVEGYFSENDLLDNYCYLFHNISGNIDQIKDKLKKEPDDKKLSWIINFFECYAEFTSSAKGIVRHKDISLISNLFFVGNDVNWKITLLTLFYKGETKGEYFEKILKLLEILCFKIKLGDFRSDYLPHYSKNYFNKQDGYDITKLFADIKEVAIKGFKWYWNNNDYFKNIIFAYFETQNNHYNNRIIKYILWQYENDLRLKTNSGALLNKDLYDNYTIEHIKPQTPESGNYTDDFEKNHLHKAGNLSLLTQSQNSRFSNKSFEKKLELFQDTTLISYKEIRDKSQWTENEINERHQKIVDFVRRYFNTDNM